MGFLDNSTNNVVLDAVLTDYGRQKLSMASNSFEITHFSLGDDEVDYRMIKKYGRTVGKEKIEKNTPIFEGLTNQSIAMKYSLVAVEDTGAAISTVYMPYLTSASDTYSFTKGVNSSVNVSVDVHYRGTTTGGAFPTEFIQNSYQIKVSDRFFFIESSAGTLGSPDSNASRGNAGDPSRTATYTVSGISTPNVTFKLTVRNIDKTTLSVYGKPVDSSSTKRTITSYVTVTGVRHGCTLSIPVTYTDSL